MTLLSALNHAKAMFQLRAIEAIITEGQPTMTRHKLDGNAIAADLHYGQDRATDHDFCDACGCYFGTPDDGRDDTVTQHPTAFMWCQSCADDYGDDEHD